MAIRRAGILVCLVMIVLASGAQAQPCDDVCPASLVPGDAACASVAREGEMLVLLNLDELIAVIDGGAFLYGMHGFSCGAFQDFLSDLGGQSVLVEVRIFNQTSTSGAQGLFFDPGSGSGDPVDDWQGDGDCRLASGLLSHTIQFWEKCLFVSITALSTQDGTLERIRCLADDVLSTIQLVPVGDTSWGELKTRYR